MRATTLRVLLLALLPLSLVAAFGGWAAITVEDGQYTARLTVPEAGRWTITIHSGFGKSDVTLLPLPALAPGAPTPAALSDAERGRRLFVAKGCVTCHLHRAVNETSIAVGPELTTRRFAPEYLARFLAEPSAVIPPPAGEVGMPNLHLKPEHHRAGGEPLTIS